MCDLKSERQNERIDLIISRSCSVHSHRTMQRFEYGFAVFPADGVLTKDKNLLLFQVCFKVLFLCKTSHPIINALAARQRYANQSPAIE